MDCPGTLFIISAPSGGGKTSLVRAILGKLANIKVSVSHTTRAPRPAEIDGKHYHFVDEATFQQYIDEGRFLEHAKVFKYCYGTSKDWVQSKLVQGIDVILEIDWQGARRIREQMSCKGIFIMPPSKEALRARLTGRSSDAQDTIEHRMEMAGREMSHFNEYDYVIINDQFEQAVIDLESVIRAERLTLTTQKLSHQGLFERLLGNAAD